MLLNLLTKEEKFYFIDLLSKVFIADGQLTPSEKKLLEKLKQEMGEDVVKHKASNLTFEKLVAYFAEQPKTKRNVIYYNLTWVSLLDDFYSVEVHELLDQIQHEFMITSKKKAEVIKAIGAEKDLHEKLKRLLIE